MMTTDTLRDQLRDIDALRERVLGQLAAQTDDDKIVALEMAQPRIAMGSKGHEGLLATGYGFDKETAELIIKERKADPRVWPFEMFTKAKAYLAALKGKPTVSSDRKPWRVRSHARRVTTV